VTTYYRVATTASANDLEFDPAASGWQHVRQPVLAIWGARDRLVPIRASAQALAAALARSGNRDRTFRTFAGAPHSLAGTRGYLAAAADWLRSRLAGPRAAPVVRTPLPPANGPAPVAVEHAGIADRAFLQLAWLLLPAVLLAAAVARAAPRRRPLAAMALADVLALAALAGSLAAVVSSGGRGIAGVAGIPLAFLGAGLIAAGAAAVTVGVGRSVVRARRAGDPGTGAPVVAVAASIAWLALVAHWLV
jgi:hypothetical protein